LATLPLYLHGEKQGNKMWWS